MIKDKTTLIGLILAAIFMLIVVVVTATRNAPILMGNSLLCLGLAVFFIATEKSTWGYWHRYRESENRFWCFVAALFATGVLFAADSPASMGATYPRTATTLVFFFVLYVNHWERSLARKALGNRVWMQKGIENQNRFPSALFSPDLVDSAREKLRTVISCLEKLDYRFAALKTWNQQDILRRERKIVQILSEASCDELNYILTNVNLPLLFYKIKDSDLLTPARLLAGRSVRKARSSSTDQRIPMSYSTPPLVPSDPQRESYTAGSVTPSRLSHIPGSKATHFRPGSEPPPQSLTPDISPALMPVATPDDVKMGSLALAGARQSYMSSNHAIVRQNLEDSDEDDDCSSTRSGGSRHNRQLNQAHDLINGATPGSPPLHPIHHQLPPIPGGRNGVDEVEDIRDSCWSNLCGSSNVPDLELDGSKPPVSVRNRTQVLNLVAEDRLPELKIEARALVISALQRMPISAHAKGEHWVSNIILSTHGESLRKLKHLLDTGGDIHSLHKLVFTDIRTEATRKSILNHLSYEAKQVLQYRNEYIRHATLPFPNSRMRPALRKILSDVDDTLFSSGGRFPAGIDTKFEHHMLYPGVLTFYKELDIGIAPNSTGEWPAHWKGNLAFLSARPHVFKDWSQKKSYQLFQRLKKKPYHLHTTPTLLAGELFSSFQMFRGDFEPMAQKKLQNFAEYSSLYGEYTFVFIGDNGQGDVRVAEMMIERDRDRIEAVFIHKVQKLHLTPGYSDKSLAKWDEMGIIFFDTYVGACLEACKRQLVSIRGLQHVAATAVKEFKRMRFHNEEQRVARLQELNRDIERCNDFFLSMSTAKVPYVPAKHVFARGCLVDTNNFGMGRVLEFRHHDGMYEIELTQPGGTRIFTLGSNLRWATKGSPGDRVWTPYGTGILQETRDADGVHIVNLTKLSKVPGAMMIHNSSRRRNRTRKSKWKIRREQMISMRAYIQPRHIRVIKAAVGDRVTSAFGQGIVKSYRKSDGVYEVLLPWGRPFRRMDSKRSSKSSQGDEKDNSVEIPRFGGAVVRAYLVAPQIHLLDSSSSSRCIIS
mmetsp:Transcript_27988/g.68027  ORF Transcript_27988/g.68027 Transcript_27988/m.68027 type:complete len:1049 (-) Transcript_27988:159-3305(-)